MKRCDVDNPKALIVWYFNGVRIMNNGLLIINNFKQSNYGTYKCIASSDQFSESISTEINVIPPGIN